MSRLDQGQALNSPANSQVTQKAGRFTVQILALAVGVMGAVSGFAWWHTGSVEFIRPWLSGKQLVFAPAEIQCGELPPGEIVVHSVRFKNLGYRPIVLTGAHQQCTCITLDEFPITISPGKDHQISLKIKMPLQPGPFEQLIKIFSDASGSTSTTIKIVAVVRQSEQ